MDRQDSRKILERFFELLKKQAEGGESASALPPFGPGDEITLRVESVQAPRKFSVYDHALQVPVQLDVESEIRLVALLFHLDFKNGGFTYLMDGFREQICEQMVCSRWDDPEGGYSKTLPEYLMRQKLVHMDPERIAAILGEFREPEAVSALLDLLREVDLERAKAVEAALPPSPEAMQAELEALRRQVSELEAERDALLRAQQP